MISKRTAAAFLLVFASLGGVACEGDADVSEDGVDIEGEINNEGEGEGGNGEGNE